MVKRKAWLATKNSAMPFFGNRPSSIKIHNMRHNFKASGCNRVFPDSKWACWGAGCMRKHSFISRINEIPFENFITNIFIAILLIFLLGKAQKPLWGMLKLYRGNGSVWRKSLVVLWIVTTLMGFDRLILASSTWWQQVQTNKLLAVRWKREKTEAQWWFRMLKCGPVRLPLAKTSK